MTYLHTSKAITGDRETTLSPAWVGFNGGFITYVDSQKPLNATPENIREFDKSVTLTPNLMNIHNYISRKSLRFPVPDRTLGECAAKLVNNDLPYLILHSYVNMLSYLKNRGTTYVCDQGLTGYTCINPRQAIGEGLVMEPYIGNCGMSINITGERCYRQSIECDGPDAVCHAVRIQHNKGAGVIKFMGSGGLEHFPQENPNIPQFTPEGFRAGTDAVHGLGRDCAIHAYSSEGIRHTVLAGIDHTKHGCVMTGGLIEEMTKRGTHLDPTTTGIRGAAKTGPNAKYWGMLQERVFSGQGQGVRWAKVAGILIGVDTDTAETLRDEIAMITDTLDEDSMEAIGRATGTNARIAKRDDMGLLEVGCLANIAAFDDDLTKSLDGLAHMVQTWKDGTICK